MLLLSNNANLAQSRLALPKLPMLRRGPGTRFPLAALA